MSTCCSRCSPGCCSAGCRARRGGKRRDRAGADGRQLRRAWRRPHEAITLAPRLFGPGMPQPCDPAPRRRRGLLAADDGVHAARSGQTVSRGVVGRSHIFLAVQMACHRAPLQLVRTTRRRSPRRALATIAGPLRGPVADDSANPEHLDGTGMDRRIDGSCPDLPRVCALAGRALADRPGGPSHRTPERHAISRHAFRTGTNAPRSLHGDRAPVAGGTGARRAAGP